MKDNISRLKTNIALTSDANFNKENTKEAELHTEFKQETIQILKYIRASKDINQILEAERILITTQLVKSKEQEESIKKTLEQFESGQKSLSLVYDKEKYKIASQTYSNETRDSQGLPVDSFRQFLNRHNTRLKNNLTNPESNLDAQRLKEQQLNLKAAQEIYKERQKEALTVNPLIEDIKKLSTEELIKKYPDRSKDIAFIKSSEEHLKKCLEEPLRSMAIKGVRENVATRLDAGEKMPEVKISEKTQTKERTREADRARD